VAIQQVDASLARALGLARPEGALIAEVEPGGPADKAGIKAGDLILRVDQSPVTRAEDLPRVVARNKPGTKVKVEIRRERVTRSVDVNLDEVRDESGPQAPAVSSAPGSTAPHGVGVQLSDVPGQGVVIARVIAGSPADGELAPGDLIVEVNRTPVTRAADVVARITATPTGTPILFKVTRQGKMRFVAVERR
jgi:serine protease Do